MPALDEHLSDGQCTWLAPSTRIQDVEALDEGGHTVAPKWPVAAPGLGRGQPMLSTGRRVVWVLLGVLWLVVIVRFWWFWTRPTYRGDLALYIPATLAFAYLMTGLPTLFWFYVGRMRRPVPVAAPRGLSVAVITLCVPSHESIDVIERQLRAITAVRYPHDSWVLDEGGDAEVERLAHSLGVRYFTRKGVARWNEPGPPFQARTKAGNVNAWLDALTAAGEDLSSSCSSTSTTGHGRSTSTARSGSSSIPLSRGCRRRRQQQPGVVGLARPGRAGRCAPRPTTRWASTVTAGRRSSSARTRRSAPAPSGRSAAFSRRGPRTISTPSCWRPPAIPASTYPRSSPRARDPEDLGTYLGQQFAWAYSMVQILLFHTPRLLRRYTPRQSVQFLMAQSWYTFWSLSIAVLWALPIAALLSDRPITTMQVGEFLAYYLATLVTSTLMWWACRHWFQPAEVRLSWRAAVLEVARWPIVLWAVINVILHIKRPYMITRKGAKAGRTPSGLRLYGTYFGLLAIGLGAVFVFALAIGHGQTQGYLALVLLNCAIALAFLITAISLELRALRRRLGSRRAALRARAGVLVTLAVLGAGSVAAVAVAWAPLVEALG